MSTRKELRVGAGVEPRRLLGLAPVGERDLDVPADEAVDEDRDEDDRRGDQEQPWSPPSDLPHGRPPAISIAGVAVSFSLPALSYFAFFFAAATSAAWNVGTFFVCRKSPSALSMSAVPGVGRDDAVRQNEPASASVFQSLSAVLRYGP